MLTQGISLFKRDKMGLKMKKNQNSFFYLLPCRDLTSIATHFQAFESLISLALTPLNPIFPTQKKFSCILVSLLGAK